MRDVIVTTFFFIALFTILTTEMTTPIVGLSVETLQGLRSLISQLIFWGATLYLCATGSYGALMRKDRFGLSHSRPALNNLLSWFLLVSPFLSVLVNAHFVLLMLGLLMMSHARSKTDEERDIQLGQSRFLSNMLLIPIFTLALILMSMNNYEIGSIFDIKITYSGSKAVEAVDGSQGTKVAQ